MPIGPSELLMIVGVIVVVLICSSGIGRGMGGGRKPGGGSAA